MPQKHYGDLGIKTVIDTCLNSIAIVWVINHVPFGLSFLEGLCSFLAGITILLSSQKRDIKYLLSLNK